MTYLHTITIHSIDRFVLLAGQAKYVHMGRRFRRGGSNIEWSQVLSLFAVIAAVILIAWLVSSYFKYREKRNADSPKALFEELCRAHGLDWSSQRLLRSLATAHGLESPAQMFMDPTRFAIEGLNDGLESSHEQITALRSQLFGT